MGKRVTIEMNQSYAQCQQHHYNGFKFHTISNILTKASLSVSDFYILDSLVKSYKPHSQIIADILAQPETAYAAPISHVEMAG